MACSDTRRVRLPVHSDGSTTAQFIPFLRMSVAQAAKARLSIVLEGSSGNLTVETAARYGEKETDLPTATPVDFPTGGSPTSLTANGQAFGSAYRDLDASEQLVEFGLNVKNTTGTRREMGAVTLVVDTQK